MSKQMEISVVEAALPRLIQSRTRRSASRSKVLSLVSMHPPLGPVRMPCHRNWMIMATHLGYRNEMRGTFAIKNSAAGCRRGWLGDGGATDAAPNSQCGKKISGPESGRAAVIRPSVS
jgi:hypothetical protein